MIDSTKLSDLGKAIIDGPINVTSYYIFKYLQKGNIDAAQSEYFHDGDKINSTTRPFIEAILGCRLHGDPNCPKPWCARK